MRAECVEITVPARLHLGLLDLDGGLGRRFGSLGLALEGPYTRLRVSAATGLSASGPDADRASAHLAAIVRHFGLPEAFHVEAEAAIPQHNGLGSGTQLALAVGMGVVRLAGLDVGARDVARVLDRGRRSGIGIGVFEHGGVMLDGGRGPADEPPPILTRLPFPDDWRVLLILDETASGLHGECEVEAFQRLPPFPARTAAHLCRLMVMATLPALAERDLERFGAAVAELQRITGDYFARAQGGRFFSKSVADVLAWLEGEGVAGTGQSSWGPTGFALLASDAQARSLAAAARRRWPRGSGLRFEVRRGRNTGADIAVTPAARALLARS